MWKPPQYESEIKTKLPPRKCGKESQDIRWSVTILSAREDVQILTATIDAVIKAVADVPTIIDVVVNGNSELANATWVEYQNRPSVENSLYQLRIWNISVPDKAYAWNTYVHKIWPNTELAFFVDGYAHVNPNALSLMDAGMTGDPHAFGGTGIPSVGQSAKRLRKMMLHKGGIHGNLYAIKGPVLAQLRDIGFKLPYGIYRSDSLLGAVLSFSLDPSKNSWDPSRIRVEADASWFFKPLTWWKLSDLRSHAKRQIRQAQGVLENAAIKAYLAESKLRPESLAATISEVVNHWVAEKPQNARALFLKKPTCYFAWRKLRSTKSSPLVELPELVGELPS